jgi:antitoxin VapB
MALEITDPAVEQAVRDLALERGQSVTELIGRAVEELKTRGHEAPTGPKPTVDRILRLLEGFPSGPVDYSRTEDEILGYGPHGYSE